MRMSIGIEGAQGRSIEKKRGKRGRMRREKKLAN